MPELFTVKTRTLPPTETKDKRVKVTRSDGPVGEYPWDHQYDAPEMHLAAVYKLVGPRPSHIVNVYQTGSDAMGYTYRVTIEERSA